MLVHVILWHEHERGANGWLIRTGECRWRGLWSRSLCSGPSAPPPAAAASSEEIYIMRRVSQTLYKQPYPQQKNSVFEQLQVPLSALSVIFNLQHRAWHGAAAFVVIVWSVNKRIESQQLHQWCQPAPVASWAPQAKLGPWRLAHSLTHRSLWVGEEAAFLGRTLPAEKGRVFPPDLGRVGLLSTRAPPLLSLIVRNLERYLRELEIVV